MRLGLVVGAAGLMAGCMGVLGAGAQDGPVVNPADNPILGSWVFSSGGLVAGACSKAMKFEAHTQTVEWRGKMIPDKATYAVSPGKVYVQSQPGPGYTKAFVIISKNEIMDTMGTGACHWVRE